MNRHLVLYGLAAALLPLASAVGARSLATVDIKDAIGMTRIQRTFGRGDDLVFSPDGSRFVCVVWRGDLASDHNIYSLLMFDLRKSPPSHTVLLTDAYQPDPDDQHATPISGMRFLSDRTLAFLGTLSGGRTQVHAIDLETRALRVLASRPTPIRSYSASTNGTVIALSALSARDERLAEKMYRTGFSVFDEQVPTPLSMDEGYGDFTRVTPRYYWSPLQISAFARTAYGQWHTSAREYFLVRGDAPAKRLLHPSAGYMATDLRDTQILHMSDLAVSPTGTHAVVVPFTRTRRDNWERYRYFRDRGNPYVLSMVTSLGLVDLQTGRSELLLDAPVDFYRTTPPLWAPDGKSVIVRSVPPSTEPGAFESDPHLIEVDIATRRVRAVPESAGWEPVRWQQQPDTIVVRRGSTVGISRRHRESWQPISVLADRADTGFNPRYVVATNGSVIIGVKDGLTSAPELAAYDTASRRATVLTDLNPDLRRRQYAAIEKVFWPGPANDTSFGYLVKPLGFVHGKRYPAVVLLKDEGSSDTSDDSFILDGQQQPNGWAIQTFAARGLLVLLTPAPPSFREVALTSGEGPRIVAHVENAVASLADRGLIDPRRVGISGWSRAAYWTDYILTHSRVPFAAATDIDGGGNYRDFQQRWGASDEERDNQGRFQLDLRRIRAPLLSEQYGEASLLGQGEFIMALQAFGKPVDLYYYPDAPHGLRRPLHRLHSLQRHLDWFRFWLQDYEDSDPTRRAQYARWRTLRALRDSPTVEGR